MPLPPCLPLCPFICPPSWSPFWAALGCHCRLVSQARLPSWSPFWAALGCRCRLVPLHLSSNLVSALCCRCRLVSQACSLEMLSGVYAGIIYHFVLHPAGPPLCMSLALEGSLLLRVPSSGCTAGWFVPTFTPAWIPRSLRPLLFRPLIRVVWLFPWPLVCQLFLLFGLFTGMVNACRIRVEAPISSK